MSPQLIQRGRVPVIQGRDPELKNAVTSSIYVPAHWLKALDSSAEANNLTRNELMTQLLLYAKRKEKNCSAPPPEEIADADGTSARFPQKWWAEFDEMAKKADESRAATIQRLLWAGMVAHGIRPKR